jgi:hypothetical protein
MAVLQSVWPFGITKVHPCPVRVRHFNLSRSESKSPTFTYDDDDDDCLLACQFRKCCHKVTYVFIPPFRTPSYVACSIVSTQCPKFFRPLIDRRWRRVTLTLGNSMQGSPHFPDISTSTIKSSRFSKIHSDNITSAFYRMTLAVFRSSSYCC